MKTHVLQVLAASLALTTVGSAAAESEPQIPADIAAMLKEHRGQWHGEGQWIENGKAETTKADWECKPAVGGIGNVCTWHDQWADGPPNLAMEVMGYDAEHRTMTITRVTDKGLLHTVTPTVHGKTMIVRWTSKGDDGKTTVGFNEVIVKSSGYWEQHMTIDTDGKRVIEMKVTHRRSTPPAS